MPRLTILCPLLALLTLAACETMQGAGRDMQTAGALLTQQAATSQSQIGSYAPSAAAPAPGY
ncbi:MULTISPECIES: entericidin A/B family lipoprotein [unclassified Paracoccus (in: a-proteobacteria)]|uniref:entericidin A/B family lipoprotein n=1 Tax=unclassified Paracoccus (in: a-proteobacteria) TaxID=2688777 RepID=UPI0012B28852|nr:MULTISPECIES: entericidin A/B family lipoprotein [unclassified Paracoccus (in: a-proteobacteria)]UXU74845.1 entericidin A/B family lipoprotein [Paracoccus sp. SMMA_5]UXU80745.1 entericidin A/B family lipoprotein [Paracoccus sp. SMMA_5_TC]